MGAAVDVGEGSIICAGVHITTNVAIGRHVHINLNCTVGHDTVIEDFVSISPLHRFPVMRHREPKVMIGVSAVVLQGLEVGEGAVVGGSACVVRDVAARTTVKGVPAR